MLGIGYLIIVASYAYECDTMSVASIHEARIEDSTIETSPAARLTGVKTYTTESHSHSHRV